MDRLQWSSGEKREGVLRRTPSGAAAEDLVRQTGRERGRERESGGERGGTGWDEAETAKRGREEGEVGMRLSKRGREWARRR